MLLCVESRQAASGTPEQELVARARDGDRAAFEALMNLHLPRVWRVAWRVLRHHEDTEDVVQEVFLAAHRALPSFRGDARFSTWLHRIAVNRALNHRRRSAERVSRASLSLASSGGQDPPGSVAAERLADPGEGSSPLRRLEAAELRRRLARCLEKLPPPWRSVLALRDGEQLSYQEIAQVLETALGTVRSRLARARLALRRCVQGEEAA